MKKVVIALALIAAVAFAGARGYGGFVLSYMMPDFDALNRAFSSPDLGLPEMEEQVFTYGGGGWGGTNLMVGGWGFGGGRKFDGDSVTVKMSYGGGFFEPGYFINIYRGFGIMPSVGIGGTAVSMELRPILGDVAFDSLLVNPGRTSRINYGTFTVAPSLTILIPIEFIAIQIKGGYMWSPITGAWDLEDGADLRHAPDIEPSGPYASVGILFGGGD
ncbi:hypothetical protein JXM67_02755 [candidate division WOR-3 bacterium]|nr:hypothetical protein [candidate division WOR-3 bacterium]